MAINVSKKQVVGKIEKINHDNSVEVTSENVGTVTVPDNHASITVSAGITRNLGNYEALKYMVSLSLPCEPTAEDIEATYNSAKDWVDGKLSDINDEITSQLG